MSNEDIMNSLRRYKDETPDFQRGYDAGWNDAYHELEAQNEEHTPPLLRRFFWYSIDRYEKGRRLPWIWQGGTDEWCNPVLSIRLIGGVLNVRCGLRLRGPKDGQCSECDDLTRENT